jgi:hypothetical protein
VRKFLAANPGFKGFKICQPRIYVMLGERWIEFNQPRGNRR